MAFTNVTDGSRRPPAIVDEENVPVFGRVLRITTAALAALVVGLAPATHAHAAPSPEELEQQIQAQWELLEPVIEQYNAIEAQLKANRAKAEALQKQLEPLQLQVDMAMGKVQRIAVQTYKGGRLSTLNALLNGGPSVNLADQLSRLEALARRQKAQISDVAAVRDKYLNDKRALDGLIEQQAVQEKELATKKKQIEDQIAALQKLRQAAYGSSPVANGALRPVPCPPEVGPGAAAVAVRTACAQIGKMYLFAAEGPDRFDCSGLVVFSWKAAGKSLPRTARDQYYATQRVSRADLRAGDLVFYYPGITHVGIYVGQGWMVHSSRAGEPVRMRKIDDGRTPIGYGRVA
jgi:peptidoglycan DL-endopeptidase CwlO